MKVSIKLFLASIVLVSLASCSKDNPPYMNDESENTLSVGANEDFRAEGKPEVIVIKAAGDIEFAVSEFRVLLGNLNTTPNIPPEQGGRREINWDGVPSGFTNNDRFPADFFAATDPALPDGRKRGLLYSTPGNGFSVSDSSFSFIDPTYENQFRAFSGARTFIAAGSNLTDNFFKVPGTDINASVQGFGAVFSDVNNASSTSMEFYDGDRLLGTFKVPNVANNNPGGFSFLGVYFPNEQVTRVRIFSGSVALAPGQKDLSDGGGKDLVIMDDFIYSEPKGL